MDIISDVVFNRLAHRSYQFVQAENATNMTASTHVELIFVKLDDLYLTQSIISISQWNICPRKRVTTHSDDVQEA